MRFQLKFLLSPILILFLLLSAVGCAARLDPADSSATSGDSASTQGNSEGDTRMYTGADGKSVEVPAHPQRVVMAGFFHGEVLALGVALVGAVDLFGRSVVLDPLLQEVESVGSYDAFNLEKILALNPDLIMTDSLIKPEVVEQLSQIAPTVFLPSTSYNPKERLRQVAEVFGMQQEAEAKIAQYEEEALQARELLKGTVQPGETALVLQISGKNLFLFPPGKLMAYTVYDALGFAPPDRVVKESAEAGGANIRPSLELLPEYAAGVDRIFIQPYSDANTQAFVGDMEQSGLWTNIPAVQSGHVYTADENWGFYDILTREWELGQAVNMLVPSAAGQ